MSTSDGNSTTRPLRRRKSKRFDRSGGSPMATASTVLDDGDVEVDLPDEGPATSPTESVAVTPATGTDSQQPTEAAGDADGVETDTEPTSATQSDIEPADTASDATQELPSEMAAPHRTLDQLTLCGRCGHEVSTVRIEVDGNVLMMESCDNCDTRRWQLAGEPIELQAALDHVGEHTGRRR